MAATFPAFLVAPLAGSAADRLDRRRLMVGVSVAQSGAAALFLAAGEGTAWLAFAAQAAVAGLGGFFAPAAGAALPNLVDPEDLPAATVLQSATWGAMLAIGAALGGAFTAAFGRDAAFVADAASFLVAAVLIASVRRPFRRPGAPARPGRAQPLADTVEAVRYARAHPAVLALLGSKMGFGLGSGVIPVLAVLATRSFGAGDAGVGLLYGARGVGVVLGPLVARRLVTPDVGGVLLACGASSLVFGAAYLAVAASPALALAAVAVAVGHLGGGAQWTLSTYGLTVATPDDLRGRIFAGDFALVTLSMSASFLASGAASEAVGPRPVLASLAGVATAWGLAYLALTRRFRRVEEAPPPAA